MNELFANSGDPDQTLCSAASDLGLHCLPITLWGVSRLQWVEMPKKPASENVVCLCCLHLSCKLFKSIFAYRQTVWTLIRLLLEKQPDLGPHCLQKWLLKSQADDKADNNCCDWQFRLVGLHSTVGIASNCRSRSLKFKSQLHHLILWKLIMKSSLWSFDWPSSTHSRSALVSYWWMCTSIGYPLRGLGLLRKSLSWLTDWLDMTITVLTGPQTSKHKLKSIASRQILHCICQLLDTWKGSTVDLFKF